MESEVDEYIISDEYINGYLHEDYAILVLKKPLGKETGHLGIYPLTNLDQNIYYDFSCFYILADQIKIDLLEEKRARYLDQKEKEKIKTTKFNLSRNNEKNVNSMNSIKSNFRLNKFNEFEESNSYGMNSHCPDWKKLYFSNNNFEGKIKIKENVILHKYKEINKIKGCPIFVNKNHLSFYDLEEKNKKFHHYDYHPKQKNLDESNVENIINEDKSNCIQNECNLEFYLIGICTGKSDSVFNKATFICRNRFENIKKWITSYAKRTEKVKKTIAINLESNYLEDLFFSNFQKIDLSTITHLNLKKNSIRTIGCSNIANSNLTNLIELDLSINEIRENGVQELCKSYQLKYLEKLLLSRNNLGRLSTLYLANSKFVKNLKYLDLSMNNIRDEGILNLSRGNLANLEYLNLCNNNISNDGMINLSNSNTLKHVKFLNLSQNKISNYGLTYFSKESMFSNLISLNLSQNLIKHESVKEFSNGNFCLLKELILSDNRIGDEGGISLASGKLLALEQLKLDNCYIGDLSLFYICKGNFPYLELLSIKMNKITDKGTSMLYNTNLSFLKTVNLEKNKIGADGRITIGRIKNFQVILE